MAKKPCDAVVEVFDLRGASIMMLGCDHRGRHLPSDRHYAVLRGRRLGTTDGLIDGEPNIEITWPQERKPKPRRKVVAP